MLGLFARRKEALLDEKHRDRVVSKVERAEVLWRSNTTLDVIGDEALEVVDHVSVGDLVVEVEYAIPKL